MKPKHPKNVKIQVLLIEPFKAPNVVAVEPTMLAFMNCLRGNITAIYPWGDAVALICKEDCDSDGIPNRIIRDSNGKILEVIYGSFLLCGAIDSNFTSLNPTMIDKYFTMFLHPEDLILLNDKPTAVRLDCEDTLRLFMSLK